MSFSSKFRAWYISGFVLVALLIGGGTIKGLPSTLALELLALPMIFMVRTRRPDGTRIFGPLVWALIVIIGASFALQLVPLPAGLLNTAAQLPTAPQPLTLSRDIGRTLDSLAFTLTMIITFLAAGSLDRGEQNTVLATLLVGVVVNFALAFIQFAAVSGIEMNLVGYTMRAGIFANPNHFSSLLYVSIPFWVYQFDRGKWRFLTVLPVLAIVFLEFAAGSTAGILITLAASLLSLAFVWRVGLWGKIAFIAPVGIGLALLLLSFQAVVDAQLAYPLNREVFASSTLDAIRHSLPFGTGFGTFPIVYPQFAAEGIYSEFVNHAHDDMLELALEGGWAAIVGMVLFVVVAVAGIVRAARDPFVVASFLAMLFLVVHSLVDYPLRTAAMAVVFAYCCSVVLASAQAIRGRRTVSSNTSRRQAPVRQVELVRTAAMLRSVGR